MNRQGSHHLTSDLVESLGSMIVRGDAPAGESLPNEAELARQFDASRTVIREAVKMLTAKGLIGSRPRRGTYVQPERRWNLLDPDVLRWTLQRRFTLALLREFLVLRRGIEPLAASEAAKRRDPDAMQRLAACLEEMRASENGEVDALQADISFHVAILEASGNRFLRQFEPMVETALRFSIRLTNMAKGVTHASVADHATVYEAVSRGNARKAERAMDALIDETIALVDKLARQGGVAASDVA